MDAKSYNQIKKLEHELLLAIHRQNRAEKKFRLEKEKNKEMEASFQANPSDWWYVEYLQKEGMKMARQLEHQQEMIETLIGKYRDHDAT